MSTINPTVLGAVRANGVHVPAMAEIEKNTVQHQSMKNLAPIFTPEILASPVWGTRVNLH